MMMHVGDVYPSWSSAGDLYYNPVAAKTFVHTGKGWVPLSREELGVVSAIGWLMSDLIAGKGSVVIAVTNNNTALVRDTDMVGQTGWKMWRDGSCDVTVEGATQRYEDQGYVLLVQPTQVSLARDPWEVADLASWGGVGLDQGIEDCMGPLLGALVVAAAGHLLPALPMTIDGVRVVPMGGLHPGGIVAGGGRVR